SGSAMRARTRVTASASPRAMMPSASSGWRMRCTVKTGVRRTARFTAAAAYTPSPCGAYIGRTMPAPDSPMLTSRKSTRPRAPGRPARPGGAPGGGAGAAALLLAAAQPQPAGAAAADSGAHRLQHLDAEAHPVLERAAIGVRAPVAARREELVDQVA